MKQLAIIAIALLTASCGDPDSKLNADPGNNNTNGENNVDPNGMTRACTFDADCRDAEACENAQCVPVCSSDADCAAGEFCAPGTNTELQICWAGDVNNISPNNISPNNISPNNISPNNINNQTVYYLARIQSEAFGADACDITDPGPDLFAVGLEDTTGNVLGWGRTVWSEVTFDNNDHTDDSVLDGAAPSLGADNCPDMFDGNVVSLGCDATSWLIVEFIGFDGQPVPLVGDASQQIRVYEYGAQCGGTVVDAYRLDICTDTQSAREGQDSSCSIAILIGAEGEQAGTVSGF